MALRDVDRLRELIPGSARQFIEEARELQRVARGHVIPLVEGLRGYGATDSPPLIRPAELKQGYLNLLFVQLHHLIEQQIFVLLRGANPEATQDYPRDQMLRELHEASGIDVTMLSSWTDIDELRLIANAGKHANAQDSQRLRELRPEFFTSPALPGSDPIRPENRPVLPMIGLCFWPAESEYDAKVDAVEAFWKEFSGVALGTQPLPTLGDMVAARRYEIFKIAGKHGATNIRLFGSVARGECGPTSDIDLLVDLLPGTSESEEATLARELERLLGRKVDLFTEDTLHHFRRKRILEEASQL